MRPILSRAGKPALLAAGIVCLALGALGVVLPLLPTTPFVVLSVVCLGRSHPDLAARLTASPVFGPALARWTDAGAIAPRAKAVAVAMMLASLIVSLALGLPLVLTGVQAICLAGVAAFVLSRPNGTGQTARSRAGCPDASACLKKGHPARVAPPSMPPGNGIA